MAEQHTDHDRRAEQPYGGRTGSDEEAVQETIDFWKSKEGLKRVDYWRSDEGLKRAREFRLEEGFEDFRRQALLDAEFKALPEDHQEACIYSMLAEIDDQHQRMCEAGEFNFKVACAVAATVALLPVVLKFGVGLDWLLTLLLYPVEIVILGILIVVVWDPPVATLVKIVLSEYAGDDKSNASEICAPDQTMLDDWSRVGCQSDSVTSAAYYSAYHGHYPTELAIVRRKLQNSPSTKCNQFVYLLGDSTLDNKHWLIKQRDGIDHDKIDTSDADAFAAAVNGYEEVLKPARMAQDVSYWMNKGAAARLGPGKLCTLMTAVEESTLRDRSRGLLVQDCFIRDHITSKDTLVVSLGGWAPGFSHFVHLFGSRVLQIVNRVCAKSKPRKILLCVLYYLDEKAGGSWADHTLGAMGYDTNPAKLQLILKTIHQTLSKSTLATSGVEVVPLFEALDGKNSADYVERVEPSLQGGHKMAELLLDIILKKDKHT